MLDWQWGFELGTLWESSKVMLTDCLLDWKMVERSAIEMKI